MPTPKSIEQTLAEQANSAMASGADPKAVTERLGKMVSYLRANTDFASHANDAIAQGADPLEVAKRIQSQIITEEPAPLIPAVAKDDTLTTKNTEQPSANLVTHVLNTAQGIPGVEAVEAAGGMIGSKFTKHPMGYQESLKNLREMTGQIGGKTRFIEKTVGAIPALLATGGQSAALQGAGLGAADQALSADPSSVGGRIGKTIIGGLLGSVLGKASELAPNVVRTAASKPLGKLALARKAEMAAKDAANYGRAAAEGTASAAYSTPQAVTDALNAPDIKPFVDAVRNSRSFANADDATLLREAYKLMSEHQRTLGGRLVNATDFKAGTSLGKSDIGLAKQELQNAADQIMPSFRTANETHAELAGQQNAFNTAADATRRISGGSSVAGKKLATQSPEAFTNAILKMKAEEANAAREAVLARLKERTGFTINPLKGFGIPKSATRINRMAPYLQKLDDSAGGIGANASLLARLLGLGATGAITQ